MSNSLRDEKFEEFLVETDNSKKEKLEAEWKEMMLNSDFHNGFVPIKQVYYYVHGSTELPEEYSEYGYDKYKNSHYGNDDESLKIYHDLAFEAEDLNRNHSLKVITGQSVNMSDASYAIKLEDGHAEQEKSHKRELEEQKKNYIWFGIAILIFLFVSSRF